MYQYSGFSEQMPTAFGQNTRCAFSIHCLWWLSTSFTSVQMNDSNKMLTEMEIPARGEKNGFWLKVYAERGCKFPGA